MAFTSIEPIIVEQAIATNSTTQNHPLGTIVRAVDSTYGMGEFIYLLGVTGTVVGMTVEYDSSFQTGLATMTLVKPTPCAVAMSANVGSEYGWYQIAGEAVMKKTVALSFAAGSGVGIVAGYLVTLVSSLSLAGALVAVLATGSAGVDSARVMVNRPHGPAHEDTG